MDSGLDDATVLVTGASGGIGQATVRALANEGARVAVHYLRQAEAAQRLLAELPTQGLAVQCDLRDEADVQRMFDAVIGHFGRLDALVANAGVWVAEPAPVHAMSLEQWRSTIDVDLTSAFLSCRGYLRHLREVPREWASIVLIGSTAAVFGEENHADYSAAKAGLAYGLTRTLKNEIVRLAPLGRVNCVCPGWTRTPMARRFGSDPEAMERALSTMALRKVALPEDIAQAVVYLTSPRLAGHISGAVLTVAGGMEGRLLHY